MTQEFNLNTALKQLQSGQPITGEKGILKPLINQFIATKDHKPFIADLKPVYRAHTLNVAQMLLDELEEIMGVKYPIVIKS